MLHTLITSSDIDQNHAHFSIPMTKLSSSISQNMVANFTLLVLPYIQRIFEVGSWPWTLARQVIMMISKSTESLGSELKRISVDRTVGPLGRLTFAYMLSLIRHPASQFFAQQGFHQISPETLLLDMRTLYRGSSQLAKAGRVLFESI